MAGLTSDQLIQTFNTGGGKPLSTGQMLGNGAPSGGNINTNAVIPNGAVPQPKITPSSIATNPDGTTKSEPITAISSSDVKDTINNNNTDTKNIISSPQGAYTDPNGIERNADGSEASAPAGAILNPEAGVYSLNGKNYTRETGVQGTAIDQANLSTIAGLRTKGDALFAEGMGIIQKQYEDLINTQKDVNMRAEAGLGNTLTASGADRYSVSAGGIMQGMVSQGLTKISELVDKENSALLDLKTAYQNNDAKLVEESMNVWKDIKTQQTTETKALMDKLTKANEDAKAEKQKQQDVITTNRNTILGELAKNNAPQSVIDAVGAATTVSDMIKAAGDNLLTMTGDYAGYPAYKRATEAKGLVPLEPNDWLAKDTKDKATAKATEAYNTAYGTAKGKAAGEATVSTSSGVPLDNTATQNFLKGKTPEQIAAFNAIPDTEKSSIMQLVNGDALLTDIVKSRGAMTTAQINDLVTKATAIDPKFSINVNKQRYTYKQQFNNPNGKEQTQINSINTALGHLAEFKTASDALGNKAILPYNKLKNYLAENVGDPTVSNLNTVITALSGELASVYKGGTAPTDQETDQWRNTILSNFASAQSKGVADTTSNLISNKLQSLAQSYKNIMGSYPSTPIINSDSLSELKNSGVDTSTIENKLKSQGYDETTLADPKTQVETLVSSDAGKSPIDPKLNTQISTMTGGKTFNTVGELTIYMGTLPGATPEGVLTALKNLGLTQ